MSLTTHRLLCPVLGRKDISSLEQVQQRAPSWSGAAALAQSGEAGEMGLVQPGEEEALRSPNSKPPVTMGRLARRWNQA